MSTPFDTRTPLIASTASERSRDYLRALMLDKAARTGHDVVLAAINIDAYLLDHSSQREVSANIDRLKAEGYTGVRTAPLAQRIGERDEAVMGNPTADVQVPAGRYAVATNAGATNELAFYKVDRPTEGRWAGYVFVKLLISDDEQRLSRDAGIAVLAKIAAAGVAEASAAYGHEIGECGVCGRTLTNDESRARGIGPVCIENMGW